MMTNKKLSWKIDTVKLLDEIHHTAFKNKGSSVLIRPFQMFRHALNDLVEASAKTGDDEVNSILARMCLLEVANPNSAEYDKELAEKIIKKEFTSTDNNGWISVDDRLPHIQPQWCLVFTDIGRTTECRYVTDDWILADRYIPEKVTHWQPLPQPPQEN